MMSTLFRTLEKIIVIVFVIFLGNSSFEQNGLDNDVLRVMTYNIRFAGDEEKEGVNAWSKKKFHCQYNTLSSCRYCWITRSSS